MGMRKTWMYAAAVICLGSVLSLSAGAQEPPNYKVDPFWPKELPNNWMLGHVEQIVIDDADHIWVLHFTETMEADDAGLAQTPPLSECCIMAPEVLEFDTSGKVLKGWGGPKYVPDWPAAVHAFWVDKNGNVWVGGNHEPDRQVLKFSKDGKQLLEIGHPSSGSASTEAKQLKVTANNQDTTLLGAPSSIQVDEAAHEVFIGDGYINSRVVVYDSETGAFKRGWGAYGMPLSEISNSKPEGRYDPGAPPSKQFRGPVVGIKLSTDKLLYVCDRGNDRIQVFTEDGKFVKELFVSPKTPGEGSTMALAFSRDPHQKYLYVGDGSNNVVWILNRDDGTVVGKFGHRGHNAGQFDYLDSLALDSHGNLYTGEVKYNDRLQKFILEK
jgi:hypothetical protein